MQTDFLLSWLDQYEITPPSKDQLSNLDRFLGLLLHWNRRFNLTAARDRDTLVRRHLMDALTPLAKKELWTDSVLDIGSGGGFPGIPLAICLPSTRFTLVERVARKCAFLIAVKRELKLEHLTVLQADLGQVEATQRFHTAITRAVRVDQALLKELKRLGVNRLVSFDTSHGAHTVFRYQLPAENRERFLSVIPVCD